MIFSSLATFATSGDEYKKGYVIVNADTLSGSIKLLLDDNNVLIQNGTENQYLTAKQIDKIVLNKGTYVGYEIDGNSFLFEALYLDGKSAILYKEHFKFHALDEDFLPPFFITTVSGLEPVFKNKDLLEICGADKKWMAQYIKNENIDLETKEGVIQAFEYYSENKL